MEPPRLTPVKDLKPGSKNLTMILIVLQIDNPTVTKTGSEIRCVKVADGTGSVNFRVWDEPGRLLQPGDIIRVHRAYATLFRDSLNLYIGQLGRVYKVDEFCMLFSETPDMSKVVFDNPAAIGNVEDEVQSSEPSVAAIAGPAPKPQAMIVGDSGNGLIWDKPIGDGLNEKTESDTSGTGPAKEERVFRTSLLEGEPDARNLFDHRKPINASGRPFQNRRGGGPRGYFQNQLGGQFSKNRGGYQNATKAWQPQSSGNADHRASLWRKLNKRGRSRHNSNSN